MCTMPNRVAPRSYVGRMVPERAECRLASERRGGLIRTSFGRSMVVARRLLRHAAILHRHFHDGPGVELAHGRAVDFLPWGRALGNGRQPFLLSARDLLVGHQRVAGALGEVDADAVTRTQPG